MTEEKESWFKLHRKILDSPEWTALTSDGVKVMLAVMCCCNWKESEVLVDGTLRKLTPGQWILSERNLAKKAMVSRQNVRTALKVMEKTNFLTRNVTQDKHTIITINKWEFYQNSNTPAQHITHDQPNVNPPLTHDQPYPKKGIMLDGKKKKTFLFEPEHLELAELLHARIIQNNPEAKVTDSQINNWADVVRLMEHRDKRSLIRIREVIEWSQSDDFWRCNILSMDKLRKQWNKLTAKMIPVASSEPALPTTVKDPFGEYPIDYTNDVEGRYINSKGETCVATGEWKGVKIG